MTLDPKAAGNERYLFHSPGKMSSNYMATKGGEEFPEPRDRVSVAGKGDSFPTPLVDCDIPKFEKTFGSDWIGWREPARGTVEVNTRLEPSRPVASAA